MPIDGSSTELLNPQNPTKKKRSNKKRRNQKKFQGKTRTLDGNESNVQSNGIKNGLNSNRYDLNKLTPANLASLRWDNVLTDPILENDRIERYKELRRQRYIDARQHAIQTLMKQIQVITTNDPTNTTENEQQ